MQLPDKRLDRRLSFGCGALLGFVLGFFGALSVGYELAGSALIATGVAIAIGVLTLIFGDRVLMTIFEWFA